jgi:hypothetical protein
MVARRKIALGRASSIYKRQTRLQSERAPYRNKIVTVTHVIKIWS